MVPVALAGLISTARRWPSWVTASASHSPPRLAGVGLAVGGMGVEAESSARAIVEVDHLGQPDIKRGPVPCLAGVAPQLQVEGELARPAVFDQRVGPPPARGERRHQFLRGTPI